MSAEEANHYKKGIASWYGYESGRMTANGEVSIRVVCRSNNFCLSYVCEGDKLENRKSIIVRVNDVTFSEQAEYKVRRRS